MADVPDLRPLEELALLPMDEAIDYWRQKLPLTPAEFEQLTAMQRMHAFTVSGVTALDVLIDIQGALGRAIEQGLTVQEFAEQANQALRSRGWEGLTPYQVDNIFRTNIGTAFSVGRYKQMTDPAILAARPFWQYDALNDGRTRPSHRALDQIVRRADDPFWEVYYPPNGYRCRCDVLTVSAREVEADGLTVGEGIPDGALPPDKGWAYNPARVAWQPDLSKYPAGLRQLIETRLQKAPVIGPQGP